MYSEREDYYKGRIAELEAQVECEHLTICQADRLKERIATLEGKHADLGAMYEKVREENAHLRRMLSKYQDGES